MQWRVSTIIGEFHSVLELSRPKNEDNLKNEENLKNKDNLKNEEDLKNKDNLKNEDKLNKLGLSWAKLSYKLVLNCSLNKF